MHASAMHLVRRYKHIVKLGALTYFTTLANIYEAHNISMPNACMHQQCILSGVTSILVNWEP